MSPPPSQPLPPSLSLSLPVSLFLPVYFKLTSWVRDALSGLDDVSPCQSVVEVGRRLHDGSESIGRRRRRQHLPREAVPVRGPVSACRTVVLLVYLKEKRIDVNARICYRCCSKTKEKKTHYVSRATLTPTADDDPSNALTFGAFHGCNIGEGVIKKSEFRGGTGLEAVCCALTTAAAETERRRSARASGREGIFLVVFFFSIPVRLRFCFMLSKDRFDLRR